MGNAGQHTRQGQRWWHRQDVRYWYALGIAFVLVGAAQIGFAAGRSTESGYVTVGIVYLLIAAGWFAVGGYKHRHEPSDATRD
jgi:hypothetical protein